MAGEQDAVEIVGLALEPVGAGKTSMTEGTGVVSSVCDLDADAAVLVRRQQVIDDVETLLAAGIVGAADVDEGDEAAVADRRAERSAPRRCRLPRRRASARHRRSPGRRSLPPSLPRHALPKNLRASRPWPLPSARSCRCGGSSSAAAGRRRAAPRPSAGSRGHRCRPARCGRSRGPRHRNNGSSRRRWRTSPSR